MEPYRIIWFDISFFTLKHFEIAKFSLYTVSRVLDAVVFNAELPNNSHQFCIVYKALFTQKNRLASTMLLWTCFLFFVYFFIIYQISNFMEAFVCEFYVEEKIGLWQWCQSTYIYIYLVCISANVLKGFNGVAIKWNAVSSSYGSIQVTCCLQNKKWKKNVIKIHRKFNSNIITVDLKRWNKKHM